jgi:hypothetical protein
LHKSGNRCRRSPSLAFVAGPFPAAVMHKAAPRTA